MEKNEIKKLLYKIKPKANLIAVTKTGIHYTTEINCVIYRFLIPLGEIGDVRFEDQIEAQLLIRYIL